MDGISKSGIPVQSRTDELFPTLHWLYDERQRERASSIRVPRYRLEWQSTALGVISYILGDYATDLAGSSLEKWGRVVIGEGVDLVGARFAKCEEISDEAIDAPRIKSWTGENSMRVRPMRKEWITFEPSHKLWLTFNAFPQINDSSDATYRRIKPIPFNASFSGSGVGPQAALGKLKAETPGILNWMLEGCRKWQADGLARTWNLQRQPGRISTIRRLGPKVLTGRDRTWRQGCRLRASTLAMSTGA